MIYDIKFYGIIEKIRDGKITKSYTYLQVNQPIS